MPKEAPRITRNKWMEEPLTVGEMKLIVADLKDFIRSTVKGTENVLRKESKMWKLGKRVDSNEEKIETHPTGHP